MNRRNTLLPLFFLLFFLSASPGWAARIGGGGGGSSSSSGMTAGATYYVNVDPSGVQSGAFNMAGGSITANEGMHFVGTGGSSNSKLDINFVPLPRSGGFGPQEQEVTLYNLANNDAVNGVAAGFYLVSSTVTRGTNTIEPAASRGHSATLVLDSMNGDGGTAFMGWRTDGTYRVLVNRSSMSLTGLNIIDIAVASGTALTFQSAVLTSSIASGVPLRVKGAPSQTGNLQELQDSNLNIMTLIRSDGSLEVGKNIAGKETNSGRIGARLFDNFLDVVGIAATASSSSDRIIQFYDIVQCGRFQSSPSTGYLVFNRYSITDGIYFGEGGDIGNTFFRGLGSYSFTTSGDTPDSRVLIQSTSAVQKVLTVRGASSQTASLLELQNSSGLAVSSFSAKGDLYLGSGATLYFNSDGTNYKITHTGTNLRLWGGNSGGAIDVDTDGHLVPQTSGFQDLGTDALPWRHLKATDWTAGNGSVQYPSIVFQNNTSMGFWSPANQQVGLSLGNARTLDWINPGGTAARIFNMFGTTSVTDRPVAVETFGFSDTTDATRKGRYILSVVGTSTQTAMQVDTDGTTAYTTFTGSTTFIGPLISTSVFYTTTSSRPWVSACGTTPSIASYSTNQAGKITVGGGVTSSCTLNFGTPLWVNPPACIFTSNAAVASGTGTSTASTFVFGGTSITSDVIMYICEGSY